MKKQKIAEDADISINSGNSRGIFKMLANRGIMKRTKKRIDKRMAFEINMEKRDELIAEIEKSM